MHLFKEREMPFSSDFKRTSIFLKLYFLPSIALLIGIISYGLIQTKLQKGFNQVDSIPSIQHSLGRLGEGLNQYKVAVNVLNVRTEPTTNSAIKTKLYYSEKIQILEIRGDWARVDGGWVLLTYLQGA